ncbi:MAG: hypothetical protein C4536_01680 [Actinobacteria bacterium]|jgi:hypothetical protein|nr:MAG: hypothetical protein C4536_01680 [Actinomycetota bacterium]
MEKEIMAAARAIDMLPEHRTTEKLEANLGGFGSFNIAIFAAANAIAEEMKKPRSLAVDVEDARVVEIERVAKKSIDVLRLYGADASNAALVTAAMLYWAGAAASAGLPTPNRKLGGLCRMAADAPASRMASRPTEKLNNKISGFAATLAVYQAMMEEHLAPYDPNLLPPGLAGSPVLGHTAIGEDYLFPEVAKKVVPIAVKAMLKSYESVGMKPCRWMAALMAAGVALEILHPDAYIGEEYGPMFKVRTYDMVGKFAVEAAGIPEVLHIRGSGDEISSSKVIGELGLMLKDCGSPTVVGMIMFNEICSIIEEGPMLGVGRSGGPIMLPLHHWATAPALVLYHLGKGATEEEVVDIVIKSTEAYFQREDAAIAINNLSHKAHGLQPGPVTDILFKASEPVLTRAMYERLGWAYDRMKEGATVADLAKDMEDKHTAITQEGVAKVMSKILGRDVEYVKYLNIRPGAGRRKSKIAQKFFAFDGYLDVEVKVDGKVYEFDNFLVNWAPKILLEGDEENLPGMAAVCLGVTDLLNSGACSMDIMVVVNMAVAFGMDPKDAADAAAEHFQYLLAIPADAVLTSAEYTKRIMNELKKSER